MSLKMKQEEDYILPAPAPAKAAASRSSKLAARARKTMTFGLVLLGTFYVYSCLKSAARPHLHLQGHEHSHHGSHHHHHHHHHHHEHHGHKHHGDERLNAMITPPPVWPKSTVENDHLILDADTLPETVWGNGVSGFNYFRNLYLSNGTWIVYTSDPEGLPPSWQILTSSVDSEEGLVPSSEEWRVIVKGQEDPFEFLGPVAIKKTGVTVVVNDAPSDIKSNFLGHYFHFMGEVLLGAWRAISASGEDRLPARLMLRGYPEDLYDDENTVQWLMQSVLPSTAVESESVWEDRIDSGMTFLFEGVSIVDQQAAMLDPSAESLLESMSDLTHLSVPYDFWTPVRDSLRRLLVAQGCDLSRAQHNVPVVTYLDNQLESRRLNETDHVLLIEQLRALEAEGLIEFADVTMSSLRREDRFCKALRSDIMLGVHGEALTNALWMKPGSGIVELQLQPSFDTEVETDYAHLAGLLNHDYVAIQNNTDATNSAGWYSEDGQRLGPELTAEVDESNIAVYAPAVSIVLRRMVEDWQFRTSLA